MNVQVFRGRTLKEAQRAAMQKLGPEAIVVTTRTVPRPGISGLLGGSEVEIAAMAPVREESGRGASSAPPRFAPGAYANPAAKPVAPDIGALRAELKGDIRTLKQMIARADGSSVLAGELTEIKELHRVDGREGVATRRQGGSPGPLARHRGARRERSGSRPQGQAPGCGGAAGGSLATRSRPRRGLPRARRRSSQ